MHLEDLIHPYSPVGFNELCFVTLSPVEKRDGEVFACFLKFFSTKVKVAEILDYYDSLVTLLNRNGSIEKVFVGSIDEIRMVNDEEFCDFLKARYGVDVRFLDLNTINLVEILKSAKDINDAVSKYRNKIIEMVKECSKE
jgi:hypothetical protein